MWGPYFNYFGVKLVVDVCPRVVGLDDQIVGVQDGEAVVDVSAELGVDVAGDVFADSGTVPA